jgi:hypothetical protein
MFVCFDWDWVFDPSSSCGELAESSALLHGFGLPISNAIVGARSSTLERDSKPVTLANSSSSSSSWLGLFHGDWITVRLLSATGAEMARGSAWLLVLNPDEDDEEEEEEDVVSPVEATTRSRSWILLLRLSPCLILSMNFKLLNYQI